jgi:hypothetical protein
MLGILVASGVVLYWGEERSNAGGVGCLFATTVADAMAGTQAAEWGPVSAMRAGSTAAPIRKSSGVGVDHQGARVVHVERVCDVPRDSWNAGAGERGSGSDARRRSTPYRRRNAGEQRVESSRVGHPAQTLKPGVAMPDMTAFTGEELRALVSYLEALE